MSAARIIGPKAIERRRVAVAFGSTLRHVRREQGLTQEEVALIGGFDRTYPSLLERGLRTPTLGVLFRLANALGIAPCRFVTLTEDQLSSNGDARSGEDSSS
jgi:transcriptional regulator with XRE-family HTH domain